MRQGTKETQDDPAGAELDVAESISDDAVDEPNITLRKEQPRSRSPEAAKRGRQVPPCHKVGGVAHFSRHRTSTDGPDTWKFRGAGGLPITLNVLRNVHVVHVVETMEQADDIAG